MFCNTSCSSSDLSCGQVDKRCVKIPWYQISQQAMTTTSSNLHIITTCQGHQFGHLGGSRFPTCRWSWNPKRCFQENICKTKPWEKASQKKMIWTLKGGEWWIKNPFSVKLENFSEREEPTAFWTHPRVDLWLGIRTPASATSFKAFTSILPKDS